MEIGKERLPGREGGDTFKAVSSHVCNGFHSKEVLGSQYPLTLQCSHLLAGLCSSSEKKNFSRRCTVTLGSPKVNPGCAVVADLLSVKRGE